MLFPLLIPMSLKTLLPIHNTITKDNTIAIVIAIVNTIVNVIVNTITNTNAIVYTNDNTIVYT